MKKFILLIICTLSCGVLFAEEALWIQAHILINGKHCTTISFFILSVSFAFVNPCIVLGVQYNF